MNYRILLILHFHYFIGSLIFLNLNFVLGGEVDCNPRFSYSGKLIVHQISTDKSNNDHQFIAFILPISASGSNSSCGMLNFDQVLATEALLFAQRTFLNRYPEQNSLGLLILDSCSMEDISIRDTVNLETCSLRFSSLGNEIIPSQIRLYSTVGSPNFNKYLRKALKVFEKPVFAMQNEELEIQYPIDFLEDVSKYTNHVLSLVHLLKQLNYMFVGVIYSASTRSVEMYRAFQHTVEDNAFNICYDPYMAPETNNPEDMRDLLQLLRDKQPFLQVIVLLTDSTNSHQLFTAATQLHMMDVYLWIAFSTSLHHVHAPALIPKRALYLMDSRYLDEFRSSFFPEAAAYTGLQHNPWLFDYLNCSKWDAWMCRSRLSQFPLEIWLMHGSRIQRLIDTFDLLTLSAQDPIATNLTGSLTVAQMISSRAQESQITLSDLSIFSLAKIETIDSFQIPSDGSHNLYKWRFQNIGNIKHISESNGTRISLLVKRALMPVNAPQSAYCIGSCSRCPDESIRTTIADNLIHIDYTQSPDILPSWMNHKGQQWAMIVTGLAGGQLLIILIYEVFCLFKLCINLAKAPPLIQSSALISQLLLFSLFLLTLGVCTYTLNPTVLLCILQRFVVSCSLCLCYSCLFLKLILVMSSSRRAGNTPTCFNQSILLLLLVLIQVSICIQWTVYERPALNLVYRELGCQLNKYDLLRIYTFPILVLITTACTATCMRQSSTNNYEAIFILTTTVFNIVMWAAFCSIELFTDYDWLKEASPAVSLLLSAFITFVAMFFPRSRQQISVAYSQNKPMTSSEDILAWCANTATEDPSTRQQTIKSSPQSGSTNLAPSPQLRIRIPDLDRSQPGTTYVPTTRRPVLVMPHLSSQHRQMPPYMNGRVSLFETIDDSHRRQYPSASQITLDAPFCHPTRTPPPPPPPINLYKGSVLNQQTQSLSNVNEKLRNYNLGGSANLTELNQTQGITE